MEFSLEKFEALAYSRQHEEGIRELMHLLEALDGNYGHLGSEFHAQPLNSVAQEEEIRHIFTRIAAATSCFLADKDFQIAPEWQSHVMSYHRWLSMVFAVSPFHNADHVMRALNIKEDKGNLTQLELSKDDLLKFCLLYMPDSEVPLDLDALWEANKVLAASLCLVLISPRFLGSALAHSKREQILPWLSKRLDQIEDIEALPIGVLHDLYMHCSYADHSSKHDIKKAINILICRKLHQHGFVDYSTNLQEVSGSQPKQKPVMLVVLEWFGSSHSIYRTHSLTIENARRHFHVVGMAYQQCVDEITTQVFDEFIPIQREGSIFDQLRQIQGVATELDAQICYMPSVGMFQLTMWLANLRVAPLQLMALGHPATTHAHAIDYVVVEDDYVGSAQCFSEQLLKLPKDGMPYRPSVSAEQLNLNFQRQLEPSIVRIAVCATTMKLNPNFLQTCALIAKNAKVQVHFEFLIGQAQGIIHPYVERVVKEYLGSHVTVHPHQAYADYMNVIGRCDMFINPFPFGNTNGIIDTVAAGLVGICKTGPEVHEHIDQGLFERLGFPDWMVAHTIDDYIKSAIRLAENHKERHLLSEQLAGSGATDIIFSGRPEIFGDLLKQTLS